MQSLEARIVKDGVVKAHDVLKVDSFLNHNIDVALLNEIGEEFHRIFASEGVTKILTIEASGIGVACITAQYFNVPVLFAKKSKTINISDEVYSAPVKSYTHDKTYMARVSKEYLGKDDRVLILDDFLARGEALHALSDICTQAGAKVVGAGIVIEKAYQGGGDLLRTAGIRVESLARIKSMTEDGKIVFC